MFVGRKFELQQLSIFFKRQIAGLAVCCGRRRIGKSRLIEHAAKNYRFIELYGLPPRMGSTNADQLKHFSLLLAKNFKMTPVALNDWQEGLDLLAALTREGQYIILLDEISWMVGNDKDFPGKLKGVWDTQFKLNPQLRLILCGSVSSWIEKNILNNKGFVGRVSLTIRLNELALYDANKFWRNNKLITSFEKFKTLCITGGVPRYLEEINPKLSAEQNIKQLCFTKGGVLVDEFDNIFLDLFGTKAESYQQLIRILLDSSKSYEEICQSLKVEHTGGLNEKLNILLECGFIARDYVYKNRKIAKKLSKFRLKDNYLRFYLKYIENKKSLIESNLYNNIDLECFDDWASIIGLQFENLVLSNMPIIIEKLGIASTSLLSAAPYFQNTTKRNKGCQIDLLIQTKFTYYVCEIKFKRQLGMRIIQEVSDKIAALKIPKTISVRPVLIYQGDISKQIINADFFSHIISFEEMLLD